MVKEKTCLKSMNNPICVDLLISNKEKYFKSATTIDDLETAEKFNDFFKKAVNNFNLSSNEDLLFSTKHLSDPVQIAIKKYKNHPSILTIQNNVTIDQSFSFQIASTDTIYKQINLLNSKKNDTHGEIPSNA